METGESGTVYVNKALFASAFEAATSSGRHEGGHLLELAVISQKHKAGDISEAFSNATESKRILSNAQKKYNIETKQKNKLVKLIDSVSLYPARESFSSGSKSVFYSEGLVCIIEEAYNYGVKKKSFVWYVLDELRKELG